MLKPQEPELPQEFFNQSEILLQSEELRENSELSLKDICNNLEEDTKQIKIEDLSISIDNINDYNDGGRFCDIVIKRNYQVPNPNYQQKFEQYQKDLEKYNKDLIEYKKYYEEIKAEAEKEHKELFLQQLEKDLDLKNHLKEFIENYNKNRSYLKRNNADKAEEVHLRQLELYNKLLELL